MARPFCPGCQAGREEGSTWLLQAWPLAVKERGNVGGVPGGIGALREQGIEGGKVPATKLIIGKGRSRGGRQTLYKQKQDRDGQLWQGGRLVRKLATLQGPPSKEKDGTTPFPVPCLRPSGPQRGSHPLDL